MPFREPRLGKLFTAVIALVAMTGLGSVRAQSSFAERGGSFAAPVNYAVGSFPYSVVVADFNADGKPDLATGNPNSDSISILLGVGNGMFQTATAYPAGDNTEGLVVADFNGDGKLDIAAANLLSSTVSVFLGNGAGSFSGAASFSVGGNPHVPVAADFNGDGKLDIATADGGQGTVSILLGNGAGSFSAAIQYAACPNPRDLVAADFNGNGIKDVALTCQAGSNIVVLLGNGSGGFGAPTSFAVGSQAYGIDLGQFDAGGTADLSVTSVGSNKVSILLGNGAGGFAAAADLAPTPGADDTAIVDMDGDGKLDLLVTTGNNLAMIFMGSGTGSFGASTAFTAGMEVSAVAAGDFNADGKPDLAVVNSADNNVSILINNSTPPLNVAPSASSAAGSSYSTRKAGIWINRQTSGSYPAGFPFSHTGYADIDRDGDTDFIRTFSNNNQPFPVQVMINNGNGSFSDQTATRIVGGQPGVLVARKVLSGDYNADGWPDFMVLGHGIDLPPFPGEYPQLFLSNGNGTLSYSPGLEGEVAFHHGGASADVDGNGTIDVFTNALHKPYFLLNDGSGHFTSNTARVPREPDGTSISPIATEIVDIDGDGFIDLLVEGNEPDNPAGRSNAIFWGSSSGLYRYSSRTVLPRVTDMDTTLDFAVEDIDNNGRLDLVVDRTGSTNVYVGRYLQILRQTSARVFVDETPARITMNKTLLPFDYLRAQDFTGDGFVDLFIDDKNDIASGQYAWVNNGQGVFTPYAGPVTLTDGLQLSVGDASTSEGQSGNKLLNFNVNLSRPAARSVSFDIFTDPGTASPGVDYGSNAISGASIAAGQTSSTFAVNLNGDTEVEGHETFTVNLANVLDASLGDGQAQGRINNDDLSQLSIQDASIAEGSGGSSTLVFIVLLSHPMPSPVTFDITTSNASALAGSDYVARSQTGRYLDAGRTRLVFEVGILGDGMVEADETFNVTISNLSGATLADGSAVGTILNDDSSARKSGNSAGAATRNPPSGGQPSLRGQPLSRRR